MTTTTTTTTGGHCDIGHLSRFTSSVTWFRSVSVFIHVNVQFVHKVVHAPDSLVFLYFDGTRRVMLPLSFFFIFLWRVPWRRYDRIWVSFEITMSLVVRVVWAWKTTPSKLNWDFTSLQHWNTTKSQCYWDTTHSQHIWNTISMTSIRSWLLSIWAQQLKMTTIWLP